MWIGLYIHSTFAIIQKHIKPDSIIYSHEWGAYSSLEGLPEGYTHKTVNHSKNFVDPETGAHTQTVELMWGNCKK